MKFEKFDYTVWLVLAGLGLAFTMVILAGDQVGARIVRTFPADGGPIGDDGRIGIEFAQPMQPKTIEPLLTIDPATPGRMEWDGLTVWFIPNKPLQPAIRYTAYLQSGGLSQGGLPVKRELTWRFAASEPWIVYLVSGKGGNALWRIRTSGGNPEPLTDQTSEVYEFAISPDGQQIVYSSANSHNGVDLWIMSGTGQSQQQMVDCGPDNCGNPVWSPDGKVIAYSRAPAGIQSGRPSGAARLWLITLSSAQTTPLYADPQVLGTKASWSPDSRRLVFFDQAASGLRILDVATHAESIVHTFAPVLPTWSPDSQQILFNSTTLSGGQAISSLILMDLGTQAQMPISMVGAASSLLAGPSWSPAGDWVVVGVKHSALDPGSQLQLMRANGQDSRPITTDPNYAPCCYQWDPWGQSVVFQRSQINPGTPATLEIMVWSMATGDTKELVTNGFAPAWQP